MKILLVENRYVLSAFYKIFSEFPASDNLSVLVFNKAFQIENSKFRHCTILPDKEGAECASQTSAKHRLSSELIDRISITDRYIKFYGGSSEHYLSTYGKILDVIENVKPDIIIGERTTFYELLCSNIAWEKNIPYVSPQASRYPVGKTIFVKNFSNAPYVLDNQCCFPEKHSFIEKVTNNAVRPSYMASRGATLRFYLKIKSLLVAIKSRYMGDKFCTPNFFSKLALDFGVLIRLRNWKKVEEKPTGRHVIFALQLQPEANLDVDAAKFSNQLHSIFELNRICQKYGLKLYVKANPKSKYEILNINPSLLKGLGIGLLPLKSRIFGNVVKPEVVISSTGTALIEAVLHDVLPISLGGGDFFKNLKVPVVDDFVEFEDTLANKHKIKLPAKHNLLDQLASYCVDHDYPDPNVFLNYYQENSYRIAKTWRSILEAIVNGKI